MISTTTPQKAPISLSFTEDFANSLVMHDDTDYRVKSMKRVFVSAESLFLFLRSFSIGISSGKALPFRNSLSLRRREHLHVPAGVSYSYM